MSSFCLVYVLVYVNALVEPLHQISSLYQSVFFKVIKHVQELKSTIGQ